MWWVKVLLILKHPLTREIAFAVLTVLAASVMGDRKDRKGKNGSDKN